MRACSIIAVLGIIVIVSLAQLLVANDEVAGPINPVPGEIIHIGKEVVFRCRVTPGGAQPVDHLEIDTGYPQCANGITCIINRQLNHAQMLEDFLLLRTQSSTLLGAGERNRSRATTKQPGEHVDGIGQISASVSVDISIFVRRRSAAASEGGQLIGDHTKKCRVQDEREQDQSFHCFLLRLILNRTIQLKGVFEG